MHVHVDVLYCFASPLFRILSPRVTSGDTREESWLIHDLQEYLGYNCESSLLRFAFFSRVSTLVRLQRGTDTNEKAAFVSCLSCEQDDTLSVRQLPLCAHTEAEVRRSP